MNAPKTYFHVLNRGNQKQTLFYKRDNYLFFLRKLKKYAGLHQIDVIAYCLMPNHFHLILGAFEIAARSHCMHALQTSYAKAINKQQHRTGHLFQDSYQKIPVTTSEQMNHLSRYIHLNPLKAGLVTRIGTWPYSSCQEYIGMRNGQLPNSGIVLTEFTDGAAYLAFLQDQEQDIMTNTLVGHI